MLLLIEVSDTTLAYDRGVSCRSTQGGDQGGLDRDLPGETIERYTDPQRKATGAQTSCGGQTLESMPPGLTPTVDEILG